jgi:hypothetical protein
LRIGAQGIDRNDVRPCQLGKLFYFGKPFLQLCSGGMDRADHDRQNTFPALNPGVGHNVLLSPQKKKNGSPRAKLPLVKEKGQLDRVLGILILWVTEG